MEGILNLFKLRIKKDVVGGYKYLVMFKGDNVAYRLPTLKRALRRAFKVWYEHI